MPSLGDSAFIFILALILFGPKKLPELARQLGKLMGEFRRASNEFRMQMEDELRVWPSRSNNRRRSPPWRPPLRPLRRSPMVSENTIAPPLMTRRRFILTPARSRTPPSTAPLADCEFRRSQPDASFDGTSRCESTSVSHAFDSVPHVEDPTWSWASSTVHRSAPKAILRTHRTT